MVLERQHTLRDRPTMCRAKPGRPSTPRLDPTRIMRSLIALAACLGIILPATGIGAQRTARERVSIDDGWRFERNDPSGERDARLSYDSIKAWILPTGNAFIRDSARWHAPPGEGSLATPSYARADFDDTRWQRVDLPHDWAIAGPFIIDGGPGGGMGRLPSPGVGWYRRKLDIPSSDAARSIFLDVDGAMSYASVWVNGRLVGGWPFGYSSWRVDLTPYLVPGAANQLAIRLDNPPNSSRWYPGGGIYRDVWLTKTSPVHVGQWGTYVRTRNVSRASGTVDIDISVDNSSKRDAAVAVATRIYALDARGKRDPSPVASIAHATTSLRAGSTTKISGSVSVAHPKLWVLRRRSSPTSTRRSPRSSKTVASSIATRRVSEFVKSATRATRACSLTANTSTSRASTNITTLAR